MLKEYMLDFGYTESDIELIFKYLSKKHYNSGTLYNKITSINNFLKSLGYTLQDIRKITIYYPYIYTCTIDYMNKKIEDMIDLGYYKKDIVSMIKKYPMILGLSIENIKLKIYRLVEIGYKYSDVIRMGKKYPNMYGYNIVGELKKKD